MSRGFYVILGRLHVGLCLYAGNWQLSVACIAPPYWRP